MIMLNYALDFEPLKKRNSHDRLSRLIKESHELNLPDDVRKPHGHLGRKGFKRLKQKDVLERVDSIHGNRYTYSYVKYKNQITPIRVFCSEHGDFLITPSQHWSGVGCPKCKKKYGNLKKRTN